MKHENVDYEWWECATHGIVYRGKEEWWDEWTPYTCHIKAEYPVDGDCEPRKVVVLPEGEYWRLATDREIRHFERDGSPFVLDAKVVRAGGDE